MKMSELVGRDDNAYAVVDEALRTYPLTPAPLTLAPAVMARVRVMPPTQRFQLKWIDYALSFFAAGMVGLGLTLWQSVSPQLATDAHTLLIDLAQYPDSAIWATTLSIGMALAACALTLAALVFSHPRDHLRL
jgi:hypothetical protein